MVWDPFEEMWRMQKNFERMFRDLRSGSEGVGPLVDVRDEGEWLVVTIDLPGVKKEDIKLNITEKTLEISAMRSIAKKEEKKGYYYSERSSSDFKRVLELPAEVDPSTAKATYNHGVLEIKIKKAKKTKGVEVRID